MPNTHIQFILQEEGSNLPPQTLRLMADDMVDAFDLGTRVPVRVRASEVTVYRNLLLIGDRHYQIRNITKIQPSIEPRFAFARSGRF